MSIGEITIRLSSGAASTPFARPPALSFERHLIDFGVVPAERLGPMMREARLQGVPLMRYIVAEDVASEDSLFAALAVFHNLPYHATASPALRPRVRPSDIASCLADNWIELETADGRRVIAAAPWDPSVTLMRHLPGTHRRTRSFDAIATPTAIRQWVLRQHGERVLDDAICSLAEAAPEMSAHQRLSHGQWLLLAIVILALPAALLAARQEVWFGLYAAITAIFMAVALQRLVALLTELGARRRTPSRLVLPDSELPVYTVLIPLYREAHMVEKIISAVSRLDYPRAKLDIKLILEGDDNATRAAARRLPGCVDVVVVPPALPRTKPKALNYALTFARGMFVTVYDAEDIPAPDQLRRALDAFVAGSDRLACVQARLNIYNTRRGWLARQFAVEYAGLFNVLMPAFDRLGQPLMLGGTSNHFRADVLRAIGAWDPHNVTEDADIGVRLVRRGWRVGALDSDTFEEAPDTIGNWMRQRARWLRGWMQTYAVHMREPVKLVRDLGIVRFLSLQVLLAGIVLSALIHPIFVTQLAVAAATDGVFIATDSFIDNGLLVLSAINLFVGYGVVMEIGVVGLYRTGRPGLLAEALLVPFYWMLVTIAAYGALVRFMVAPFRWEKTRHRGSGVRP